MQDLVLQLNTDLPVKEDLKTSVSDDNLGSTLQSKWSLWSNARQEIEKSWLADLRAFNQVNEADVKSLSKFHSHIYIGLTRTKCMSAYSRISDLMFQSNDPHWGIEPTPVPKCDMDMEGMDAFMDDMKVRAELMSKEIEDQMIDLHYEDHVKSSILEACILGTGCIKGVIPGIKKVEKWENISDPETGVMGWSVTKTEVPAPQMSSPSIFDLYPDLYANRVEDMSGLFERHKLNRQQFSELKDDPRFDEIKINEILSTTDKGNHIPLYHETERNQIANITDTTSTASERYDLLEYWGQVSGRLLQSSGVEDVEEEETYWANVWTCSGKTLLAKVVPMKKQRIPYNFFIYNKVPHQFWGIAPARMMRHTQATLNGSVRSLLDGMAMAAYPMAEVNVTMLKDGQDPNVMMPGMVYLRDSGDPSVPAVRFFQPNVPTGQLMQMAEMFKGYADDETALPAYTYGDTSNEVNQTAKGMSMQMGAASLPIKAVVKNLEDFEIRPFITSLFDWNMEWSDKEEIKGDMQVNVLGTSALMAKETKSQQLLQFLNMTSNPIDMKFVDRKYLLVQIAKSLEIDTKKAVPDEMPEQDQGPTDQPSIVDQAKAALLTVQGDHEKLKMDKTIADTAETNVKSQFEAIQASLQLLLNTGAVATSDSLLASAGYKDHNGYPVADIPAQPQQIIDNTEQNTHPQFPPNPQSPEPSSIDNMQQPAEQSMQSPEAGIQTSKNEMPGMVP